MKEGNWYASHGDVFIMFYWSTLPKMLQGVGAPLQGVGAPVRKVPLVAVTNLRTQIYKMLCHFRYANLPPAVQWGVEHENQARIDYTTLKSAINDNFRIDPSGFTLYSSAHTHSLVHLVMGSSQRTMRPGCSRSNVPIQLRARRFATCKLMKFWHWMTKLRERAKIEEVP